MLFIPAVYPGPRAMQAAVHLFFPCHRDCCATEVPVLCRSFGTFLSPCCLLPGFNQVALLQSFPSIHSSPAVLFFCYRRASRAIQLPVYLFFPEIILLFCYQRSLCHTGPRAIQVPVHSFFPEIILLFCYQRSLCHTGPPSYTGPRPFILPLLSSSSAIDELPVLYSFLSIYSSRTQNFLVLSASRAAQAPCYTASRPFVLPGDNTTFLLSEIPVPYRSPVLYRSPSIHSSRIQLAFPCYTAFRA
jgi:hypothetical protein